MAGMKWHGKLLSAGVDYKTRKGNALGIATAILYLTPDHELCPMARTAGCAHVCLVSAGRGAMSSVQAGRLRKTKLYRADPTAFVDMLADDVFRFVRWSERKGLVPAIRLNGTSDITWENVRGTSGKSLMDTFPHVQYYDYTKRVGRKVPDNYDLTFSYSDAPKYRRQALKALQAGMRFAVVFHPHLPEKFLGRPVVDADSHDARFTEPADVVSGLRAKGHAKRERNDLTVYTD